LIFMFLRSNCKEILIFTCLTALNIINILLID